MRLPVQASAVMRPTLGWPSAQTDTKGVLPSNWQCTCHTNTSGDVNVSCPDNCVGCYWNPFMAKCICGSCNL